MTGLRGGPSSSDIFDHATRRLYGQDARPGLPHLRLASGTWGVVAPLVPGATPERSRRAAYAWVCSRNAT